MFVKETKVKRSGREYSYLQLVEGCRRLPGSSWNLVAILRG
jgi:hypothetical protein